MFSEVQNWKYEIV